MNNHILCFCSSQWEFWQEKQHDPSGMKSEDLLFAAVLGSLLSVVGLGSFVGHMKRMILNQAFMNGKCFYIQSCASCCWWHKKEYSLNCSFHRETIRYCDSPPLWTVLAYPSSSSVKNSTPQRILDAINYGNFGSTLLTKKCFFKVMRTMNVHLSPQQWITFVPFSKLFFIFRKF